MAGNKRDSKKSDSEARANALYERLMKLDRRGMSNNQWTEKAGVSTSFFTNLKSRENKPGSEPTIGNLRLVLEAAGSTIPEFFAHEARGRIVPAPTRQALEQAFAEALDELPKRADKRPAYLASTVLRVLGLPDNLPATQGDEGTSEQGDHAEDAPVRRSTIQA